MVSVRGLIYEYPEVKAVDDVSFDLMPGTITSLVGPNGSGKSTLMRCLAALTTPLAGTITINGIDTAKDPRLCHQYIGYVPDFFGLYDNMTVSDYLEYFACARKVTSPTPQEAARATAEVLGLTEKFEQPIKGLSRGMRQRVIIAQAIIHAPRVLILDEPASGLDPHKRHELSVLLKRLRQEHGMTIMVSSHILTELEEYSTDVMMMDRGRIVEHKSLNSDQGHKRVVVSMRISGQSDRALALLAEHPEVTVLNHEGASLRLEMDASETERSEMIARLVSKGLRPVEFQTEKTSLQEEYLSKMRGAGE